MIMMMMMMMTMMTNTIPYRRTKTHIWDKVLMGIWVHPVTMTMKIFHLHDHRQGWRFWRPTREGDCQLPSVKEHVIP